MISRIISLNKGKMILNSLISPCFCTLKSKTIQLENIHKFIKRSKTNRYNKLATPKETVYSKIRELVANILSAHNQDIVNHQLQNFKQACPHISFTSRGAFYKDESVSELVNLLVGYIQKISDYSSLENVLKFLVYYNFDDEKLIKTIGDLVSINLSKFTQKEKLKILSTYGKWFKFRSEDYLVNINENQLDLSEQLLLLHIYSNENKSLIDLATNIKEKLEISKLEPQDLYCLTAVIIAESKKNPQTPLLKIKSTDFDFINTKDDFELIQLLNLCLENYTELLTTSFHPLLYNIIMLFERKIASLGINQIATILNAFQNFEKSKDPLIVEDHHQDLKIIFVNSLITKKLQDPAFPIESAKHLVFSCLELLTLWKVYNISLANKISDLIMTLLNLNKINYDDLISASLMLETMNAMPQNLRSLIIGNSEAILVNSNISRCISFVAKNFNNLNGSLLNIFFDRLIDFLNDEKINFSIKNQILESESLVQLIINQPYILKSPVFSLYNQLLKERSTKLTNNQLIALYGRFSFVFAIENIKNYKQCMPILILEKEIAQRYEKFSEELISKYLNSMKGLFLKISKFFEKKPNGMLVSLQEFENIIEKNSDTNELYFPVNIDLLQKIIEKPDDQILDKQLINLNIIGDILSKFMEKKNDIIINLIERISSLSGNTSNLSLKNLTNKARATPTLRNKLINDAEFQKILEDELNKSLTEFNNNNLQNIPLIQAYMLKHAKSNYHINEKEKSPFTQVFIAANLLSEKKKLNPKIASNLMQFIEKNLNNFNTSDLISCMSLAPSLFSDNKPLKTQITENLIKNINYRDLHYKDAYEILMIFPTYLFEEKTLSIIEHHVIDNILKFKTLEIMKLLDKYMKFSYKSVVLSKKICDTFLNDEVIMKLSPKEIQYFESKLSKIDGLTTKAKENIRNYVIKKAQEILKSNNEQDIECLLLLVVRNLSQNIEAGNNQENSVFNPVFDLLSTFEYKNHNLGIKTIYLVLKGYYDQSDNTLAPIINEIQQKLQTDANEAQFPMYSALYEIFPLVSQLPHLLKVINSNIISKLRLTTITNNENLKWILCQLNGYDLSNHIKFISDSSDYIFNRELEISSAVIITLLALRNGLDIELDKLNKLRETFCKLALGKFQDPRIVGYILNIIYIINSKKSTISNTNITNITNNNGSNDTGKIRNQGEKIFTKLDYRVLNKIENILIKNTKIYSKKQLQKIYIQYTEQHLGSNRILEYLEKLFHNIS